MFAGEDVTYKEFSTAFQAMYFDTEKKSQAEKALHALKQTRTVAHYTHAFNIHAHNASWEPSTLVSQYTQGLKKDIRLALILARTEFNTLTAVTHLALKIDNEINGAEAAPGPAPTTPAPDPNAMDISAFKGRLSNSKRARMMCAGLCFRCSAQGHLSRDCPQKGKAEATRISKLEAELARLKGKKEDGEGREGSKNGGAQA
jgi:hypothetical protein